MAAVSDLKQVKVLITRQQHVTDNLVAQLHAHNALCVCLPLFAVEPKLDNQQFAKLNKNLANSELAIFISRNAAELVMPHLDINLNITWACIGPTTAEYLQQQGIQQVIYPPDSPYDSQALMRLLQAKHNSLLNGHITIFTGDNGNAWLQEELRLGGATVEVVSVYSRVMPAITTEKTHQVFSALPKIDIILITCVTSLINLRQLTENAGLQVLDIPLLVVSDRIYRSAIDMGFTKVYTAKGMSDADIMSGLFNWRDLI